MLSLILRKVVPDFSQSEQMSAHHRYKPTLFFTTIQVKNAAVKMAPRAISHTKLQC